MVYSKKQMQPLINKFGINPDTNKLFIKVCEMFDGKSNYQVWAVRMIFSQLMTFEQLQTIHDWIENNSNLINKLEKQNIVSYTKKTAISQLMKEIEGLNRISFIKNIISHFNTEQRRILNDTILCKEYTPLEAYNSAKIHKWYDIFSAFNKKPTGIKNNFYSTCSALKNADALHQAILDCLEESYIWKEGKEDLLAFIEHNTKDCEVVFNEGDTVIVRVPSFESARKLCGGGRTGWCLCREETHFINYVTSCNNRTQYFLFDFSRKETDAFAHIGFTISGKNGIVEAQTCHNFPMIEPYTQKNESLSIYNVLDNLGIGTEYFIKLPKDLGFKWNMESIIKMVKENPESMAIAYKGDGFLVLNLLTMQGFLRLVDKTYIGQGDFYTNNDDTKIYLFMNFNLPFNDEKSMLAMQYNKDYYGSMNLSRAQNIYGKEYKSSDISSVFGVSSTDFLGCEKLDPSIMLHKLIDENNESGAIELIENEYDNINVNYMFNQRVPVFSAVNKGMTKLFDVIVNHEGFVYDNVDGFGESLLGSLIYLHVNVTETEKLEAMIKTIISCRKFNCDDKDINNITPLIAACKYPKELWLVKELVSKRDVDVNAVDDFDCTAITNCIRSKNLDALKELGKRPDLVIRKEDARLAKKNDIYLNDFIKPTESIFVEHEYANTESSLEYELTRA